MNRLPLRTSAKPSNQHLFTKGEGGRRKGVPNKTTLVLKSAILKAAEAVGSDGNGKDGLTGYLQMIAEKHPKEMCYLISKVLPLQLAADPDMPATVVFRSAADVRRELDQRGIDINSLANLTNDHQSNLEDEPNEVEHLQSTPPTTSLN
jgi:hypothetical protein